MHIVLHVGLIVRCLQCKSG